MNSNSLEGVMAKLYADIYDPIFESSHHSKKSYKECLIANLRASETI